MLPFKIKRYVSENKNSDLLKWHKKLGLKGRVRFETRMDYLCNHPVEDWVWPHSRPLGYGIYEIRFKCKNVQQRPLGYFGPKSEEFTFLYPAIEKDDEFIPKDAIEKAKDRKKIVDKDHRRSNDWDIGSNE